MEENLKAFAEKKDLILVDVKFVDMLGQWQHFTVPTDTLALDGSDKLPFDGSSIRGFQEIHESDMDLVPDLNSAFPDPFSTRTLSLTCDVYDPVKKEFYSRDPRYIAKKAEAHLKSTGMGDTAYFGPEAEFFIFDELRYEQNSHLGYYYIDSEEGTWNSGKPGSNGTGNLAYKPRSKEGYFPVLPHDSVHEIRNDAVLTMQSCGLTIEKHHHEVATAGQCEIGVKYDHLVRSADNLMIYKYVVKNISRKHGKVATFMPKPLFGDNGSGMHTHQSIWKDGKNLFAGSGDGGISDIALYYIGGLLDHAPALASIICPTTNSYKRLVPGFEAPVNLVYSHRNRSAAARIPVVGDNPNAKRVEFRCPDPSCNPYLAFAAMLMAGLDGVKKKTSPGEAINENIYKLDKARAAKIRTMPGSLPAALDALESDNKFMREGDVFTSDLMDMWLERKRWEIQEVSLRPHPWEFYLYHDA
ncbi:MAG TPA: type I glutamate--ammonia ligase [Candidatus Bilamarchaeaceae archaeon]|nr:type I glutamate--ammonia ligase [Candidatus Bilamarchaeaceae archaeon]